MQSRLLHQQQPLQNNTSPDIEIFKKFFYKIFKDSFHNIECFVNKINDYNLFFIKYSKNNNFLKKIEKKNFIFFHGFNGNITNFSFFINFLEKNIENQNCTYYFVDLPSHGASENVDNFIIKNLPIDFICDILFVFLKNNHLLNNKTILVCYSFSCFILNYLNLKYNNILENSLRKIVYLDPWEFLFYNYNYILDDYFYDSSIKTIMTMELFLGSYVKSFINTLLYDNYQVLWEKMKFSQEYTLENILYKRFSSYFFFKKIFDFSKNIKTEFYNNCSLNKTNKYIFYFSKNLLRNYKVYVLKNINCNFLNINHIDFLIYEKLLFDLINL